MSILLYRNINLKKYFFKNINIANTNTFRLLFKYTNDNTGIGALTGVLETRFDEPRYYSGDTDD